MSTTFDHLLLKNLSSPQPESERVDWVESTSCLPDLPQIDAVDALDAVDAVDCYLIYPNIGGRLGRRLHDIY